MLPQKQRLKKQSHLKVWFASVTFFFCYEIEKRFRLQRYKFKYQHTIVLINNVFLIYKRVKIVRVTWVIGSMPAFYKEKCNHADFP